MLPPKMVMNARLSIIRSAHHKTTWHHDHATARLFPGRSD
jgi:hypothetical protein